MQSFTLILSIIAVLSLLVVNEMAVVRDSADERTLGIVTLEDVLEALVGDIREGNPARGAACC